MKTPTPPRWTTSCSRRVAFTPKGGCPLKTIPVMDNQFVHNGMGSIHPQGWVPVENDPELREIVVRANYT